MDKGAVTIATGNKYYIELAESLARSYYLWNDQIPFYLITNKESEISKDVEELDGVNIVRYSSSKFPDGFSVKLHIDQLSPVEETLFIDADCLVTGSVVPVFDRFQGQSVSTVGRLASTGEWFGDIEERCSRFGVPKVPVFVGAVYYVRNDDTAASVFEMARSLTGRYDEMGFVRLRGLPNEEPLISVGMALEGQDPVEDDGIIKADAMSFGTTEIDVFSGHSQFEGDGEERISGRMKRARPVISHFNSSYAEAPPYTREREKLEKHLLNEWPQWGACTYAYLKKELPYVLKEGAKEMLKPLYRKIFGYRNVRDNPRIIEE